MKNTYKMLIAVGAGLFTGAVLGVLFAPDKGVNLRHKIADKSKKLTDEFGRKVKFGNKKREKEFSGVDNVMEEVL
jgi:gas vesicle protein